MIVLQNPGWFIDHLVATLCGRPRRTERFSHTVYRALERRHASIRQAASFADVGGGAVAVESAGVDAAPAAESSSDGGDDDGGDPDPESDPPALSASELARQLAAFRTTKTGIPGIRFNIPSASFRASYAPNGKPARLGSFPTIDLAVIAIKSAYASSEVVA